MACLTAVSESYAPKNWQLFSVNVLKEKSFNISEIQEDLIKIFGKTEIDQWEFLKSYEVRYALPSKPAYGSQSLQKEGVYLCGDFMQSPSIQGALNSGFQLAKEMRRLV